VQGVKTGPPSAVKITEATVEGSIEPDGAEIEYYFEYGTTTASGTKTATADGDRSGRRKKTVTATLTGLSGGTTYHYKLVAKNKLYSQLVSGEEEAFTTLRRSQQSSPGEASEVTATSATLAGSLSPNEQKPEYEETEYYFEIRRRDADRIGREDDAATIGRAEVEAHPGSREVSGVARFANSTEATTYHYRLAAHNSTGTTWKRKDLHDAADVRLPDDRRSNRRDLSSRDAARRVQVDWRERNGLLARICAVPRHLRQLTCTPYTARTGRSDAHQGTDRQAETGSNDTGVGVQITLTGLQPGTSYGYRLSARNPTVTTSSAPRTFTTGPAAPVVESEQVGEITANGALLSATIDPGNSTSSSYPTSYYFEYQRPGLGDTEMVAARRGVRRQPNGRDHAREGRGLVPDSEYAYWLVAENASGKVEGAHQSFTTAAERRRWHSPRQHRAEHLDRSLPARERGPAPRARARAGSEPATHPTPAKPLTKAQKLAKALKSCRRREEEEQARELRKGRRGASTQANEARRGKK